MWASLVDDGSYNWENLPYFKKSINYTAPDNDVRPSNASIPASTEGFLEEGAGLLEVSFPLWVHPYSSFAGLGWQALGLENTMDFVGGTLAGVQYC